MFHCGVIDFVYSGGYYFDESPDISEDEDLRPKILH